MEPDSLLDVRQIQNGAPRLLEVLIQWKTLPPFEATWEDFELLMGGGGGGGGGVLIGHKFVSPMLEERPREQGSFISIMVFSLASCFRGLFGFLIFFY